MLTSTSSEMYSAPNKDVINKSDKSKIKNWWHGKKESNDNSGL